MRLRRFHSFSAGPQAAPLFDMAQLLRTVPWQDEALPPSTVESRILVNTYIMNSQPRTASSSYNDVVPLSQQLPLHLALHGGAHLSLQDYPLSSWLRTKTIGVPQSQ